MTTTNFSANKYFLCLSLILGLQTVFLIYQDKYHPLLIITWLLSIIFLLLSSPSRLTHLPKVKLTLSLLIILLPTLVRLFFITANTTRYHDDEFLIAYYAAKADLSANIFSGFPQDNDWDIKLPITFFLIPKIFMGIFGESPLTVKLSTLPYVLITSIFLYLLSKELFDKKTALISLIIYAFFPISVYLETLGIYLVSSTAVFLPFLYVSLLNFKKPSPRLSAIQGILCALNYLFYHASFIAFPVMIGFFTIKYLQEKKLKIHHLLTAVFAFLVVLGPFLTYAFNFENYFATRLNQLNLLSGSWSQTATQIKNGEQTVFSALSKHILNSLSSLYTPGIGGAGGYNFAHLALFEPFTFLMLIVSIILGLISSQRKRVFILLTIITLSFATILLSAPPPAFHRLSLSFPFISILLTIPFTALISTNRISIPIKYLLLFILFGIYIFNSYNYFKKVENEENYYEPLKLASFINRNYPGRNIYVAAFPGFAFEKVYFFSPGKNALSVRTDYHNNLLENFCPAGKYLYVIFMPGEFTQTFVSHNPDSNIVYQSSDYSVITN